MLSRTTIIETDKLCGEDYAAKETVRKDRGDFFQDTCNEFHAFVSFYSCFPGSQFPTSISYSS